jgi:predicted SAM-dependent methyltransferase
VLKELKEQILTTLGLGPGHPWMIAAHSLRRKLQHVDKQTRQAYLKSTQIAKLHIGGGPRCLPGWLNTDLALQLGVMQMDATQPFPFEDGLFHYVFTEHMIEHIPFEAAMVMLRECQRVLKPGGVIRVTTPNLAAFIELFAEKLNARQQSYLDFFCKTFLAPDRPATPAHAINSMFRLFGHQFIYDEKTLTDALRTAGFGEISRRPLMQSEHQTLQNLENVERYPEGFLEFESIALEAKKMDRLAPGGATMGVIGL